MASLQLEQELSDLSAIEAKISNGERRVALLEGMIQSAADKGLILPHGARGLAIMRDTLLEFQKMRGAIQRRIWSLSRPRV